jgi:hypothetical protein
MKKVITIFGAVLFASLLFTNEAKAQVSVGANLGMFKSFTEGSDAQLGFNLYGKYSINDKIRVGGNLGYYFKSYDFFGSKLRSFTMPITALFEYSFSDNDFSPYAGADIGIYRFGLSGGGGDVLNFGLAPVVGFNYNLSDKLLLNGNLKYHYIMSEGESTSAFGVNAGVCYKF